MSAFTIFISHKQEDAATAQVLKEAFGQFSGRLQFFISSVDVAEGERWRQRVRKELAESDMLLLLYTGEQRDWKWCFYEAGLFTNLDDEIEPVVCIHAADVEPPGPLASLQAVAAKPEDVARFIRRLVKTRELTGGDEPLNKNVTEQQIARAADRVCAQFVTKVDRYYAAYRIALTFPPGADVTQGLPGEASVTATGRTLAIFGLGEGEHTWSGLTRDHVAADAEPARWLKELDEAFIDASGRRVLIPTSHTFRARNTAQIFRPELYRVDFEAGRPVAAIVVLTEEVAPAKVGGPIFNLLRVSERYKAEVFDPYIPAEARLADAFLENVSSAVEAIKGEAKSLGTFDERVLDEGFPDRATRQELEDISARWDKWIDELRAALVAEDTDGTQAALRELNTVNDDYRRITAQRYATLLADGGE